MWEMKNPKYGDQIRVNRGFYYHHGIYENDLKIAYLRQEFSLLEDLKVIDELLLIKDDEASAAANLETLSTKGLMFKYYSVTSSDTAIPEYWTPEYSFV